MSIVAYTGLPGSGKSYAVVENVIVPAIKKGRTVMTNIPMTDLFFEDHPKAKELLIPYVNTDYANEAWWDTILPGVVLVMDELWRLWPSGLKAHDIPTIQKSMLAEHRHRVDEQSRSMEIVLVTQDLSQVARFCRDLVEETYRATKLSVLGMSKKFIVDVYVGPVTGQSPPKSRLIRTLTGKYRPEVFRYYKSHTLSKTDGAGLEEKVDQRAVVWKRPTLIAMIVSLPLLLIFGLSGVLHFFNSSKAAPLPAKAQTSPTMAPLHSQLPSERSRSVTHDHDDIVWRVAGTIDLPSGRRVLLDGGNDRYRYITMQDCTQQDPNGLTCTVDGQIATAWTGNPAASSVATAAGFLPSAPPHPIR